MPPLMTSHISCPPLDSVFTLLQNMLQGVLVNGSVGKVVDFKPYNEGMWNRSNILAAEDEHGTPKEVPRDIRQSSVLWPVVKFTNGLKYLCIPTEFTKNNVNGDAEATRTQVSSSELHLTCYWTDYGGTVISCLPVTS